jgi:hypothetical protein
MSSVNLFGSREHYLSFMTALALRVLSYRCITGGSGSGTAWEPYRRPGQRGHQN